MRMNFVNPNNDRYYLMVISKNLFEQPEIIVSRGSNAKSKSIVKYMTFDSITEAKRKFCKLARLRLKNGYLKGDK